MYVELRKSELSNEWPRGGRARSGVTANSLGRRYVTLHYVTARLSRGSNDPVAQTFLFTMLSAAQDKSRRNASRPSTMEARCENCVLSHESSAKAALTERLNAWPSTAIDENMIRFV